MGSDVLERFFWWYLVTGVITLFTAVNVFFLMYEQVDTYQRPRNPLVSMAELLEA